MTNRLGNERGAALIAVLLLVLMMSALAAALGVSGNTETTVVRNHETSVRARAAAEAGLNHAVQVAVNYLGNIDPDDIPAALDTILANLSVLGIDLGTTLTVAGASDPDVAYEVFVMDEDDPDRPGSTTLTGDADPTNDEDGIETTDSNLTLVVRAIGHASNDTQVTLEALISPLEYGALVTGGDLTISGSVSIDGANGSGSVHSNGDLTIGGGSAEVTGTITASGDYSGPAGGVGHIPKLALPEINAIEYKDHADFILTSDGTMTNQAGAVLCTWSADTSCNNWNFNAANGEWSIGSTAPTDGTYYVEGGATITGSPGSSASPVHLSIIAEGSINISGSPDLVPEDDSDYLFITDGDLEISGGLDTGDPLTTHGRILVHEQINFTGNPSLAGQVIVEDAEDVFGLVHANNVSGNVDITYNGGLTSNVFYVNGWREIR